MKKQLTMDEIALLEAIDGIDRSSIQLRHNDDMAVMVDSYLPRDTAYVTYEDITEAYKSLQRRGYVANYSLTDLGLASTKGTVNLQMVKSDGTVVSGVVKRK